MKKKNNLPQLVCVIYIDFKLRSSGQVFVDTCSRIEKGEDGRGKGRKTNCFSTHTSHRLYVNRNV